MDDKVAVSATESKPPASPTKARPRRASQAAATSKTSGEAVAATTEKKISGAELKKQKQAEKQARRAQGRPASSKEDAATPKTLDLSKRGNNSQGSSSNTKNHKRSPSFQRTLPVRPLQIVDKKADKKAHFGQPKQDAKRVALFGHLYGKSRSTTIIGAGKDIHPAVLALGLQMSNYVVCGSTARCVAMLLAFKRVIESYITPPGNSLPRHLTSHLNSQIEHLVSCRPLATAMGNAIRWLKVEINNVDPDTEEDLAKADLCDAIDRFILERITAADQAILETASSKIRDGDVILTFGKSHIVQKALFAAHRQGRRFRVRVIDTRPLFEGRNTASELAEAGMDVQYAMVNAISHCARDATKVLLGAHSMLSNGRLYARAGTALVALMAHANNVPVIVCCESIKFSDKVALDAIVTNEVAPPDELVEKFTPGGLVSPLVSWREQPNLQLLNLMYDVTPPEYITMVVTEYGSLPPSSVPVVFGLSSSV